VATVATAAADPLLAHKVRPCQPTHIPAVAGPSRGAAAQADPPGGTRFPHRRIWPRTSCPAAGRPCSMPAAPTSRAARTC